MNSPVNISYLLSGPAYQEFERKAQRSRNFESMPPAKRQKMNPFAPQVSNNHKNILNSAKSLKTPPSSPLGVTRNLAITKTPGGSRVVGRFKVPRATASPIRKITFNNKYPSYARGGVVRATGLARLHKGELVIPLSQVAMVRRAIRMYKRRTK